MRLSHARIRLSAAVAMLVLAGPGVAHAASEPPRQCPRTPDNVPPALVPTADSPRRGISVVGQTLIIEATPNPDHIWVKAASPAGSVRVVFDGIDLGRFGPAATILVRAGDGDDVVRVEPQVTLPVRLEGGAGNDCLQGGSGPDVLFGGDGDDTLIGTPGRDALHGGQGNNRVIAAGPMGAIRVSRSAAGPVLRHLSTVYTLQRLAVRAAGATQPGTANPAPSPIVLGPADLGDSRIAPLLREANEAGQTVALTGATLAHAALLQALLGHPTAAGGIAAGQTAGLISFRKTPRPGSRAADHSTGILLLGLDQLRYRRDAHPRTIELLSRAFSATAIVPEPPSDGPVNNLLQLASSYTSQLNNTDSDGNQVQLTNMVWNVRSFDQDPPQDLYYVVQEVDYYGPEIRSASSGWVGRPVS